MAKQMSEEEKAAIIRLKEQGTSNRQVARQLGIKEGTVHSFVRLWNVKKEPTDKEIHKELNDKDLNQQNEELIINKDGTHTSTKTLQLISETQHKDEAFLLKAHGYDIKEWELVSARNNVWNVYSKLDKIQTLCSSKIVVKPRTDSISKEEIKEWLLNLDRTYEVPKYKSTANYIKKRDKLLEINLADLHFGKLCWHGDSGENYDHKIAEQRFMYIINDNITRVKSLSLEKVLFIYTNDFFHYDTIENTTTKGTRQDSDVRWQKLYLKGNEMLIKGVDLLRSELKVPIETFYVGANHDKMTSFFSIVNLNSWYRNCDDVEVSTEPMSRKYVEYGNTLIGFCHGNDIPKKELSGLLPKEAPQAWGRTKYRELHAAHYHSERAIEETNGTIIRFVSSPTGTDNYHYEHGYTGAIKKGQSFIYDKRYGLIDIMNSVIEV